MSKKNILAILIIIAALALTAGAIYLKPQLHKTFQIEILKFQKVKQ